MTNGTDSRALRLLNGQRIVDAIFAALPEAVSRPEIGRRTGLSKPTVSALVSDLVSAGFLRNRNDSADAVSVGRPASIYEIDPLARTVVGIDIGATKTVVAVGDVTGSIIAEQTVVTPENAAAALEAGSNLALELVNSIGGPCGAVCVGIPGIYRANDDSVDQALNLPGFDGFGVRAYLEETFGGIPVQVENDVNLAALGELTEMDQKDRQIADLAAISIGTGIGMGLIVSGELYRGGTGSAGELGSIVVTNASGEHTRLTLEDVAAAPALRKQLGVAIERGYKSSLDPACDVPDIFEATTIGDEAAVLVLHNAAEAVSLAISHLLFILDPAQVVLGGGVGANEVFVSAVATHLAHLNPEAPDVVRSRLGGRAALVGAVSVARTTARASLVQEMLGSRQ